MKIRGLALELGRIAVGFTLVASALLKGIDPIGLEIKVHDAMTNVLGISDLDVIGLAGEVAYTLIVLEFCIGAFLLMGIYRRLASRLALCMFAGFTLFTGYSYFTGAMPDCGCFGDAIKLTAWQSFAKNLMFLPISALLVYGAKDIKHLYSKREQWLPAVLALVGISSFVYINGSRLPLVDFRPYKVGYNIRERIHRADSIYQAELTANTRYIYEREGIKQSFSIDSLPTDEAWRYVEMKQPEELRTRPMDYSLLILTPNGEDKTAEILNDTAGVFLFVSPNWSEAIDSNYEVINELYKYVVSRGLRFYSLSPTKADNEAEWRYLTGAEYPSLFVDASTLKTMIRSNPGLIVLKDGVVIDKLSPADFPKSDEIVNFVDSRLQRAEHLKASYWRALPLGLWFVLLVIGLVRRSLRWARVAKYLYRKPRQRQNENITKA